MALLVHKYGGTSVGTLERIKTVAAHLATDIRAGHKVVVVVSAMGKSTNELHAMALQLNSAPPKRELDMLLSTGERISMALTSIALENLGLRGISLTGSQSGILTDQTHTNARISRITGERIRAGLEKYDYVIVAGFQGVNPDTKEITTLGRGGSDLTAVALAYSLSAAKCEIYSDVTGVCTADPRMVSESQVLPRMSWAAASELAWSGAKVLHARAAHLAAKYKIPLSLRSSFDFSHPGTLIEGNTSMESTALYAITSKDDLSMIEIQSTPEKNPLGATLQWLWDHGCAPQHSTQSLRENGGVLLHMLIPETLVEGLTAHLEKTGNIRVFPQLQGLSAISVIGEGFLQNPEMVTAIYAACDVPVIFADTRNNIISICTRSADAQPLVRTLHKKFFEGTAS